MQLFGSRLSREDSAWIQHHIGQRPAILAWAETADGVVVALTDRLLIRRVDDWEDVPWDDILSGGWDPEREEIRWRRVSTSEEATVVVTVPRRLPEVFRERVEATILVQRVVQAGPGRSITLTGRRSLADESAPIRWTAHPAPGVRMQKETLRFAEEELARLQAEYAF